MTLKSDSLEVGGAGQMCVASPATVLAHLTRTAREADPQFTMMLYGPGVTLLLYS